MSNIGIKVGEEDENVDCNCGCGETTSGTPFAPGHDENVRSAVMYLLGDDTMALVRIFGFGSFGGCNAKQICAEERTRRRNG